MKPFLHWLLAILAGIVSIDFITTPLTNDARIYLGVEHIASRFYPFPQGIDLAWEIKPIGNRIINYVLYNAASFFSDFGDKYEFGEVVKGIALVCVILAAVYFAATVRGEYTFWYVFFGFTAVANFCILQAEWWSCLLTIAIIGMLVAGSKYHYFAAGLLLVFLVLIKGISGLLLVPIVCMVVLVAKPQQNALVNVLGGVTVGIALGGLAWLAVWKNMVSDILLSPHLAKVGSYGAVDSVVCFFMQLAVSPIYIPILLAGGIAGAVYWLWFIKKGEHVAVALMWLVPAGMVFIHSEFFFYHYF